MCLNNTHTVCALCWQVQGRKFDPEVITMGGGKTVSAGREADWGRELTRSAVISAVCCFSPVFIVRRYAYATAVVQSENHEKV